MAVAGNACGLQGPSEEHDASEEAERNEILLKIDQELDLSLRADYLRMRAACSIPKARRREIEAAVLEIVGLDDDE